MADARYHRCRPSFRRRGGAPCRSSRPPHGSGLFRETGYRRYAGSGFRRRPLRRGAGGRAGRGGGNACSLAARSTPARSGDRLRARASRAEADRPGARGAAGAACRRFGTDFIHRLDQALGREEEAISPRRPIAPLIAERHFAEPITREEDIAASLASLAATLARSLESRGEGARLLELALFRVDGAVSRIAVGTGRPMRAPKLVADLFREKFAGLGEEIDAGFGFDMVRLAVQSLPPSIPPRSILPAMPLARPISMAS